MSLIGTLAGEGLWQLVEFADYDADLPLWAELAAEADGPVLDLGCGIGRVAGHLAELGHEVTGVDLDPDLVNDFNRLQAERPGRAIGAARGNARAIEADALSVVAEDGPLRDVRFGLVIAPQQFVQLLGGPEGRLRLLEAVRQLLVPGGLAGFAFCEELPDRSIQFPGDLPDVREVNGWFHSSSPLAIEPSPDFVLSIRSRQSVGPNGELRRSEDSVRIDRIDRPTLEAELGACGLEPFRVGEVPQTERHMGSTAVIARRPPAPRPA